MTENDVAYLAGLIDGEGSIYFRKTTNKDVILDLANQFIMLQLLG